MQWKEFLGDPELNADVAENSRPNGRYLFRKAAHDVLECLTAYREYGRIVMSMQIDAEYNKDIVEFQKKLPLVAESISQITQLADESETLPADSQLWPHLIARIAMAVKYDHVVEVASRSDAEDLLGKALSQAAQVMTRLSLILQDIHTQNYKRLWLVKRYGEL